MQSKLLKLYNRYWGDFNKLIKAHPHQLFPLLIQIPENYFKQKLKLMVIGQQTFGWKIQDVSIESCLEGYQEFNFNKGKKSTFFWDFVRKIEAIYNIEPFQIVWSNLNRCDWGIGAPPTHIQDEMLSCFPVLLGEIQILKPDILIFLTGPNFDWLIKKSLGETDFKPIQGIDQRKLCQLVNRDFPFHSYRTYHPGHFYRKVELKRQILDFFKNLDSGSRLKPCPE